MFANSFNYYVMLLYLSLAQTICDCVKLYLEKVINILESNGYYDYIDNQQFDVTDQVGLEVSL